MNIRVPINEQGDVAGHAAQRRQSAGDSIPPNCQVIEVHVAELNQLFNAIDPATVLTVRVGSTEHNVHPAR